jgi:hypothetical protein
MGLPAHQSLDPDAVAKLVGSPLRRRHLRIPCGLYLTTRTTIENLCRAVNAASG